MLSEPADKAQELARRGAILEVLGTTAVDRLKTLRLLCDGVMTFVSPSFAFRGVSVGVLAELLLDCIRLSVGRGNNDAPTTPPFARANPDLVHISRPVNISSFLTVRKSFGRTYRIGVKATRGVWSNISFGRGVERSVFEEALGRIFSDHTSFQTIGCYKVPSFPPVPNHKTATEWKTYGVLFALRIIYYTAPPIPASPFLLLALLMTEEGFATLTRTEITALDPSMASRLEPWLRLNPDMARPDVPHDDLLSLCASLEIQVSTLLLTLDTG